VVGVHPRVSAEQGVEDREVGRGRPAQVPIEVVAAPVGEHPQGVGPEASGVGFEAGVGHRSRSLHERRVVRRPRCGSVGPGAVAYWNLAVTAYVPSTFLYRAAAARMDEAWWRMASDPLESGM
jgi:hypothetical protein